MRQLDSVALQFPVPYLIDVVYSVEFEMWSIRLCHRRSTMTINFDWVSFVDDDWHEMMAAVLAIAVVESSTISNVAAEDFKI